MTSRRAFLAALAAGTALPALGWAEAGDPAYLTAARDPSGGYRLCGLDRGGAILFDLPLPGRGHAAAAHPTRAEAIAFARRPGDFALVIDCARGVERARLTAPAGRHFYGHGVFSADGRVLYTTENDLDTLEGRIGFWDAAAGYARIGDMPSGGIGPHDIARLPGTDTLVVANGGIATHPDSGRVTLNLATMRANLAYLDPGAEPEIVQLDRALRLNSIRHLALSGDGTVAAAMQWQGADGMAPPLLLVHRRGGAPVLLQAPDPVHRAMRGYAGSVALSADGRRVAITSPRGGRVQTFDLGAEAFIDEVALADVCGLTPAEDGFLASTGTGLIGPLATLATRAPGRLQWDNHIVTLTGSNV